MGGGGYDNDRTSLLIFYLLKLVYFILGNNFNFRKTTILQKDTQLLKPVNKSKEVRLKYKQGCVIPWQNNQLAIIAYWGFRGVLIL